MKSLIPRLLAGVSCGLLLYAATAPFSVAWLHWFLWVPAFWALRPGQWKTNAFAGYLGGFTAILIGYWWIIETIVRFSSLPWAAAVAIQLLFAGVHALHYTITFGSALFFRRHFGNWWILLTPAMVVALEKLDPSLFPYFQGATQYRVAASWQLASVFGVPGVSFLLFLTNCALAELIYRRREGRAQAWGLQAGAALALGASLLFGLWRHGQVESQLAAAPKMRVALLQQSTTMEERLSSSPMKALRGWLDLTSKIEADKPDLVIWPEGSVSFNPDAERKTKALKASKDAEPRSPREFFSDLTRDGNFDLLVGGGTIERYKDDEGKRKWKSFNSAYAFTRAGELEDRYDKIVPLPFGEYIPFSDTFPWLRDLIEGPGNFRPGERPTVFDGTLADGTPYTYSVPICYEAILERAMWTLYHGDTGRPVDVFVNITNDAWFGDTTSPHQHAMLTAVQAIQYGRPMIRVAYTGINWVIEPHGDIRYETTPFVESASVEELRLATVDTVYTAGGWLVPWLCPPLVFGALIVGRRRDRRAVSVSGADAEGAGETQA